MITSIKQFNSKLSGVIRSAKSIRENVQHLAVFAIAQAEEHGNLTPLSDLIKKTKPLRTIRTATLEAFIMAHVQGIQWAGKGATKALKKIKGQEIVVHEITSLWYDHDDDGVDAKPADLVARAKTLLTLLHKVDAGEAQAKEGQELFAKQLMPILELYVDNPDQEVELAVDGETPAMLQEQAS